MTVKWDKPFKRNVCACGGRFMSNRIECDNIPFSALISIYLFATPAPHTTHTRTHNPFRHFDTSFFTFIQTFLPCHNSNCHINLWCPQHRSTQQQTPTPAEAKRNWNSKTRLKSESLSHTHTSHMWLYVNFVDSYPSASVSQRLSAPLYVCDRCLTQKEVWNESPAQQRISFCFWNRNTWQVSGACSNEFKYWNPFVPIVHSIDFNFTYCDVRSKFVGYFFE